MASPDKLDKEPYESRLYDFDFSAKLLNGAVISSVDSITATAMGNVAGAVALTVSNITFTTTRVQVRLAGGTDGEDYHIDCRVIDSPNGNKLEANGILRVREI